MFFLPSGSQTWQVEIPYVMGSKLENHLEVEDVPARHVWLPEGFNHQKIE
jgi:hypothetical protein